MKHTLPLGCILLLASFQAPRTESLPCEPGWQATFGGAAGQPDGQVMALLSHDDGSGGGERLYVGGFFTSIGGVAATGLAKWDGASWSSVGGGLNGSVRAMVTHDDGSGSGPALFVAGSFSSAGGAPANSVARWDGTAWSPLGAGLGMSWESPRALAVYDDGGGGGPALYAAGFFNAIPGSPAAHTAKWDGTSWSPLGSGLNGLFYTLAVFDDGSGSGPALYVGGSSMYPPGITVDDNCVARWDGTSWSPVGEGIVSGYPSNGVLALHVHDDGGGPALYAGGDFAPGYGAAVTRVARWDGISWSTVGGGASHRVFSLASFDDGSGGGSKLYAGGGSSNANSTSRWDGASWSHLDPVGPNNTVWALAPYDDGSGLPKLAVGGEFTASPAGDVRIAAWVGCETPDEVGVAFCSGDGSGTPCPCGNSGGAGQGCANSTGAGAVLAGFGSANVLADDLILSATQVPTNSWAAMFAGDLALNGGLGIPFGGGLRCAGGNVLRLGVQHSGLSGSVSFGPGLMAQTGYAAGTSAHFQAWYRDSNAASCDSGFNTSNGLRVDLVP